MLAFIYVCLLVCLLVCMYACLCVCIFTCIYVCLYVCLPVCMFAYTYVCLYVCMYVCIFNVNQMPLSVKPEDDTSIEQISLCITLRMTVAQIFISENMECQRKNRADNNLWLQV